MKKVLLSAALAIVSGAAFAQMSAVEDEVLSAQTGQDGISIALNIKAHIDAFEWIDNASASSLGTAGSGAGGSVRFEDIAIGSGALSSAAATTMGGLNGVNVAMDARHQYADIICAGGKQFVERLPRFFALIFAAIDGDIGNPAPVFV